MAALDWLIARPIAHRGLHDATAGVVENTIGAFRQAIDGNFAIETDLQITSDGEAAVFHDDTLERLAGRQDRLADMSMAALRRVPFPAAGDSIISLGELCEFVAGRVTLLLELKSLHDRDERLPRRAAAVLRHYPGPVAVMSFDPYLVLGLRTIAPEITRGITAGGWRRAARRHALARRGKEAWNGAVAAARMRPQFVAYAVQELPAAAPLMARYLMGLPLLTWTVRTDTERARAARFADQVIFEGFQP
jgi:glycerophosphoryl diester phosphodiesterase